MKSSNSFAENSLTALVFHTSWAHSWVLIFAGLWVRNWGWQRKLWTVCSAWTQGGLRTTPAHTATHLEHNYWQLQVTVLASDVIKWSSTLITLLFEECFLLWGLQRHFIKQKYLQLLNIQRIFFCVSVRQHTDSNEKLDSVCVLRMHTYEKDNLSLVKVSSCRQLKSR